MVWKIDSDGISRDGDDGDDGEWLRYFFNTQRSIHYSDYCFDITLALSGEVKRQGG